MKTILTSIFLVLSLGVFGQQKINTTPKTPGIILPADSTFPDSIRVSFEKSKIHHSKENEPSIYIDSILTPYIILSGINPNDIKDLKVEKNAINPRYRDPNGTIFITLKEGKKVNLIPLSQINDDYVHSNPASTLYMLENTVLTDDLETYKIDKNYIFSIEVINSDDISYLKALKSKFTIIKIFIRSKENLEKANRIILRGNAETVSIK